MKKSTWYIVAALSVFFLAAEDVFARGGRGGGGRPSGGGGGGRPSASRSPSMSRPSPSMSRPSVSRPSPSVSRPSVSRPSVSRPSTGAVQRPGTGQIRPGGQTPSRGDLQNFLNLPKDRPGTGPSAGQLPATATGTRPGVGDRPAIGDRPGVGDRPAVGRPGPGVSRPGVGHPKPGLRPNVNINVNRGQINQRVNNRYRNINTRPFTRGWWAGRPAHLPAGRWHRWWNRPGLRPGYWWRWATAATLTRWVVGGWSQPVYYGYGSGGNVYYEDNVVYIDGEQNCTSQEYYQQATQIAADVPEMTDVQAEQVEWMPLGVFAVTKEGVDDSNLLLQLAVSKEGIIAGTLVNETTNSVRPVEGKVDKESQRAAWSFADGKNTDVVMETGIYNLAEDQCTLLVHFGAKKTQTWVMVRLDEPEDEQESATPAAATAAPGQ